MSQPVRETLTIVNAFLQLVIITLLFEFSDIQFTIDLQQDINLLIKSKWKKSNEMSGHLIMMGTEG